LLAQFRTASKQAQSEKAEAEAKVAETERAPVPKQKQSLARLRADSRPGTDEGQSLETKLKESAAARSELEMKLLEAATKLQRPNGPSPA